MPPIAAFNMLADVRDADRLISAARLMARLLASPQIAAVGQQASASSYTGLARKIGAQSMSNYLHDITGQRDGPTVGISASIHSDEPTETEIILELFRLLQTLPLRGRLLLLPVANPRAYAANCRFTPVDELNLNREFPGDANGNYTQQLAAAITREFLGVIDVHLDFHSGTDRPTVDYVYIWNDEKLSRSFGSTVLYRPRQTREGTMFAGTTKVVTLDKRNIPVVVVELGGASSIRRPM